MKSNEDYLEEELLAKEEMVGYLSDQLSEARRLSSEYLELLREVLTPERFQMETMRIWNI